MQPVNFNQPMTHGVSPSAPEYPYLQKLDDIANILEGAIPTTSQEQNALKNDFQWVLSGLSSKEKLSQNLSLGVIFKIQAMRTRLERMIPPEPTGYWVLISKNIIG